MARDEWLVLLCLLTATIALSNGEDRLVVSKDLPGCQTISDKFFCSLQETKVDDVYLDPLEGSYAKIFVHNVKHLHVNESYCTSLGLKFIKNIIFEGNETGKCEHGLDLSVASSYLLDIPPQVTKLYLEECTIDSISTKTPISKLTVLKTKIGVLNISSSFSNGSSVFIQDSSIETLRKLEITAGAIVTIQNTSITTIESQGLVAKNGALTFKDSTFPTNISGLVVIYPTVTLVQQNLIVNLSISSQEISSERDGSDTTESKNTSIGTGIIIGSIVAVLIIAGIVGAVFWIRKRRKQKPTVAKQVDPEKSKDGPEESKSLIPGSDKKNVNCEGANITGATRVDGKEKESSTRNVQTDKLVIKLQTMKGNQYGKNIIPKGNTTYVAQSLKNDEAKNKDQSDKSNPKAKGSKHDTKLANEEVKNKKEMSVRSFNKYHIDRACKILTPDIMLEILTELQQYDCKRIESVSLSRNAVKVIAYDDKGQQLDQLITQEGDFVKFLVNAKVDISSNTVKKLDGKLAEEMYKYIERKDMYDVLLEVQRVNEEHVSLLSLTISHVNVHFKNTKKYVSINTSDELQKHLKDGTYKVPLSIEYTTL